MNKNYESPVLKIRKYSQVPNNTVLTTSGTGTTVNTDLNTDDNYKIDNDILGD
jgi:hypothetical protein